MKSIEIISVPVTDQQRAKEFYVKLGFEIMVEAPFQGGAKWIQLGLPGNSGISITLVTWFGSMVPGCLDGFVIKVDDMEKERESLAAKGIELGKTDQTPWGKFAAVKDPDGNRWSLHQD